MTRSRIFIVMRKTANLLGKKTLGKKFGKMQNDRNTSTDSEIASRIERRKNADDPNDKMNIKCKIYYSLMRYCLSNHE